MELNDRVSQLEDEIKILKNEVQAVLLDLRESYTNLENPFNLATMAAAAQPIIINNPVPQAAAEPAPLAEPEPVEPPEPLDQLLAADEPLAPDPLLASESEEAPSLETESFDETEPEYEYHAVATAKTAQEEVTREWRPASETEAAASADGDEISSPTVDLTTMSALAEWVEDVARRFGSERAEAILDMSEMMGFVDSELRDILSKFVFPSAGEYSGKVTTRDYLAALRELDAIQGKATKLEMAVLSILCQGTDGG